MKVVVTGGAGFIGSHLSEALIEAGHDLVVLDDLSTGSRNNLAALRHLTRLRFVEGSILDTALLASELEGAALCYHLAAAVGVQKIMEQPLQSLRTNLRGTELVLEAADRERVPVVLASTSEVYGKNDSGPLSEDADRILGSSQVHRWHYATAKAADEALALAYAQETGLHVIVTRFFNTIGPRQTGRYGMVVPRLLGQALAGEPLTVYGDGQQSRCFTYVGDTVRCLLELPRQAASWGQIFNVGQSREISILALAERIIRLTGSRSEICLVPYEEAYGAGFEDMRRRVPDTTRLRSTIGYAPDTDVDTTLAVMLRALQPSS